MSEPGIHRGDRPRRVLLLPGDGIGPEVVGAARSVLEHFVEAGLLDVTLDEAAIGGGALDTTGDPLPEATLASCRGADAILLGAVGGPRWDDPKAVKRPEQGLFRLRKELGLFANLRPVRVFPALLGSAPLRPELLRDADLLVVRELTGGIYFGPRAEPADGVAHDTMLYTEAEIVRIARIAFEQARLRRRHVASVDKANVLASMRLWRSTVDRVAEEYPDVELEHVLVDAAAMRLVTAPASFDVLLAGNLFGDILSDEAAVFAGSLGVLPSASLGTSGIGLYEPIHGSAPDLAGLGLANPIGTILSTAMLLRHSLAEPDLARRVEGAVDAALDAGWRTPDLGVGPELTDTEGMTAAILAHLDL